MKYRYKPANDNGEEIIDIMMKQVSWPENITLTDMPEAWNDTEVWRRISRNVMMI